jgi:hypothetical protein
MFFTRLYHKDLSPLAVPLLSQGTEVLFLALFLKKKGLLQEFQTFATAPLFYFNLNYL